MKYFSFINDAITSQMYADGYDGEGRAAIVPIVQNKLNNITVDLTNVSYSLGVLVEIYESGTSTLITSNGPYNTSSPQHIVFPIDFTIRPTVTNVDIRIIGGPGTISPSAPPENFTVQSVTCYTYDTSNLYRDSVVAKCDDDMWYRYGFNTQEKDDEVYGKGNLNTAMFWEYDTRLGRRWNLDPKPRIGISDYSVMDGNPIIHIDIYGDRPSKRAAWAMAKVVYGKNDKATAKALKILQKEGWKVSGKDFGIKKESKEGFKSQVFERMVDEKSNKKEFAYATAGTETEDKKDMVNGNVKQLIGISPQYNLSTFNANSLSLSIGKSELSFVGHSLGGGLAAANAYATGREAITFNPSGLSNATICNIIINYGFKFMFARITAHVLLSDPLNIANTILLPGTNGNIRYHIPVDKKSWKDGHSIDNLGRSILKGW